MDDNDDDDDDEDKDDGGDTAVYQGKHSLSLKPPQR